MGANNNQKKLGYIPELDGLRGISILAVMFFHSGSAMIGGYIGVDVFFVLSGFLITSIIVNEYNETSALNYKVFYIKRLLRLGPALIFMLITFTLLSYLFLSEEKASSNLIDALISLFYVSNWARVFELHPPDWLGHTWSLSIEEQFYFLWPIVLVTILRLCKSRWTVAFIAFSIAILAWFLRIYLTLDGSSYTRVYFGLDTRADALMIGCVLGIITSSSLLTDKIQKILSKWLFVLAPVIVIYLGIVAFTMAADHPQTNYWVFFSVALSTAIFLAHLLINSKTLIHKLLSMKWLVWVGSISYGLYLWHYPIFRLMKSLEYQWEVIMTLGVIVTFTISIFSYYVLEKPILKMKKRYNS